MKFLNVLVSDAMVLGGAASMVYGGWLIAEPLAWVIAGALIIGAGALIARKS